jgi:hypothetical protein
MMIRARRALRRSYFWGLFIGLLIGWSIGWQVCYQTITVKWRRLANESVQVAQTLSAKCNVASVEAENAKQVCESSLHRMLVLQGAKP